MLMPFIFFEWGPKLYYSQKDEQDQLKTAEWGNWSALGGFKDTNFQMEIYKTDQKTNGYIPLRVS